MKDLLLWEFFYFSVAVAIVCWVLRHRELIDGISK